MGEPAVFSCNASKGTLLNNVGVSPGNGRAADIEVQGRRIFYDLGGGSLKYNWLGPNHIPHRSTRHYGVKRIAGDQRKCLII